MFKTAATYIRMSHVGLKKIVWFLGILDVPPHTLEHVCANPHRTDASLSFAMMRLIVVSFRRDMMELYVGMNKILQERRNACSCPKLWARRSPSLMISRRALCEIRNTRTLHHHFRVQAHGHSWSSMSTSRTIALPLMSQRPRKIPDCALKKK